MADSKFKTVDNFMPYPFHHLEVSATTYNGNMDNIVDMIVTNYASVSNTNTYFSIGVSGAITSPNMGANASFWYGMISGDGKWGWVVGESFDQRTRGKRKNASTFTWTG